MKKYLSIIAALALLTAAGSAYAITIPPVGQGELTSRAVGTLDGAEIEVDTYTNSAGTVSHDSKEVSKAYYASLVTAENAQIAALQAEVTENQSLSAQLAN